MPTRRQKSASTATSGSEPGVVQMAVWKDRPSTPLRSEPSEVAVQLRPQRRGEIHVHRSGQQTREQGLIVAEEQHPDRIELRPASEIARKGREADPFPGIETRNAKRPEVHVVGRPVGEVEEL